MGDSKSCGNKCLGPLGGLRDTPQNPVQFTPSATQICLLYRVNLLHLGRATPFWFIYFPRETFMRKVGGTLAPVRTAGLKAVPDTTVPVSSPFLMMQSIFPLTRG